MVSGSKIYKKVTLFVTRFEIAPEFVIFLRKPFGPKNSHEKKAIGLVRIKKPLSYDCSAIKK
jgi:hypothetical protein